MKRTLLMALTLLGLASGVLAQSERSYDNASVIATYSSDNTLSDNLADLNDWLHDRGAYSDGGGLTDCLEGMGADTFFGYSFKVESDDFFDEVFGYRLLRVRAWIDSNQNGEIDSDEDEVIIDEGDSRIVDAINTCYFGQGGPGSGRLDIGGGAWNNTYGNTQQFPVNDPLYVAGRQRHLTNANFPAAWASNATGVPGVTIGVIDTGWENGFIGSLGPAFGPHEDLNSKVVNEINFTGFLGIFNAEDIDPWSHGTRVAGLAAAATNNFTGVAGTGYDTNLVVLKVANFSTPTNTSGTVPFFNTFLALFFGHTFFGCNILNVSSDYAIPPAFVFLGDLVLNWVTRGNGPGGSGLPPSLVVASAGTANGGNPNTLRWPGSRPQVMAVGGTDNVSGKFASGDLREGFLNFSRLGPKVEASAAAAGLVSTENYNAFATILFGPFYVGDGTGYTQPGVGFPNPALLPFTDRLQGTSFAAPQVSGLAALLWAFATNPFDVPSLNLNPFSVADFVRGRVSRNTDMVQPVGGRTAAVNTGRINAGRTVSYVDRILLPTQSVATARLATNITARVVLDRAYTTNQVVRISSSNNGLARPTLPQVTIRAGQTQANIGIAISRSFNAVTFGVPAHQKVEIYADFRGTRQVGQLYVVR